MAEPAPLTVAEIEAQVAARLAAHFRGDSEVSDKTARAVAERIYSIDANRMANETVPFDSLGQWDKAKFDRMARAAIQAYLDAEAVVAG